MEIGECALEVSASASEGESVVRAVDDLLDGEGEEETERFAVGRREGLDSGEGVACATGALETDLAAY